MLKLYFPNSHRRLLFYIHWIIAVILFAVLVPGIIMRIRVADKMHKWQLESAETERKAHYYHWMMIDSSHAKEIRLFGLGSLFMNSYRLLRAQLRREKLSISNQRILFESITQACGIIALFVIFAFISYRTISGRMTIGDMVMYYQAFQRAQAYLYEIFIHLSSLYEDNLFLSQFYEFLDLKPNIVSPPSLIFFQIPYVKVLC